MQNACATTTATIRHGGPCEDGYITVGNVVVPIIDREAVNASTQTVQNASRRANNVLARGRMTRADAFDAKTHTRTGSAASRDTVSVTVAVADSHITRGSAASRDTVRVTLAVADSHSTRASASSPDTVRVTITVAEHPATAMPLAVRGGRRVE